MHKENKQQQSAKIRSYSFFRVKPLSKISLLFINKPIYIFIIMVFSIFSVELLIMLFLPFLHLSSIYTHAIVDASLLTLVIFPFAYLILFKPLQSHIIESRESEQDLKLFRDLIDKSNDAIFIIDSKTSNFLDVNDKACDNLGYEREELLKMKVIDIEAVIPDSFSWEGHVNNVRNIGYAVIEGGHKRKDNTTFPVEVNVKLAALGEKEYMIATARDISERKLAENSIRESEEMFRTMAVTAKDAIIIIDNNENISYWNFAAENIFGYTAKEAIGKDLHELLAPKHYIEAFKKGFSEFINTGKGNLIGKTVEVEAIRKDGSEFPIALSLSAIKIKDKWHAMGIVRDITERKIMEEELRKFSYLDGLTNIANRRLFDETFNREWKRMIRDSKSISLIMCDIDFFKDYNDTYGHQKGDECLISIAKVLSNVLQRPSDLAARYGGEEFAVALPDTDIKGASKLAENLRKKVQLLKIKHDKSQHKKVVTISLGVAAIIPKKEASPSELIFEADQALYESKKSGRNKVSIQKNTDQD